MPTVPKQSKCAHLACQNTRSKMNTYCLDHGGRDYTKHSKRTIGKGLYASTAWQSIRRNQLSTQPLCQSCLLKGKVEMANVVDHLFAWSQIGDEAFRYNIFQSLCKECHSVKTNIEQKGLYRHYAEKEVDYLISDYKRITSDYIKRPIANGELPTLPIVET